MSETFKQAECSTVTITDSAKEFFIKFATMDGKSFDGVDKDKEIVYLQVAVMAGGCSGFQYSLNLVPTSANDNPLENHVLVSNGISILIDSKSYELIKGLIIDYKNDLMESGLSFINPSATSTCGCNKSFS